MKQRQSPQRLFSMLLVFLNFTDYKAFLTVARVLPHSSSSEKNEGVKTSGFVMDSWCDGVTVFLHWGSLAVSPACVSAPFYMDHLRQQEGHGKARTECWGGVSFSSKDGWLNKVHPPVITSSLSEWWQGQWQIWHTAEWLWGETKERFSVIVRLIDTT